VGPRKKYQKANTGDITNLEVGLGANDFEDRPASGKERYEERKTIENTKAKKENQ
jgi:hypothetical protein